MAMIMTMRNGGSNGDDNEQHVLSQLAMVHNGEFITVEENTHTLGTALRALCWKAVSLSLLPVSAF